MARDEADRELQAEKDTQATLLDEIDELSDQLASIQEQLERSNAARSAAETRAMALASQLTHTQDDLTHHQMAHTSDLVQIAALEKCVKELEDQLLIAAAKEAVVVVTSGSQTIPPNPVTEHSSQTIPPNPVTEHSSQTIPPNPVAEHSSQTIPPNPVMEHSSQTIPPNPVTEHSCQTTQSIPVVGVAIQTQTAHNTLDMATNTAVDTPFVTAANEGGAHRAVAAQPTPAKDTLAKPTPEINQLHVKIAALNTELAGRLEAQVTPLPGVLSYSVPSFPVLLS